MQRIKWELEDLSLKYLDPVGFHEIVSKLDTYMTFKGMKVFYEEN